MKDAFLSIKFLYLLEFGVGAFWFLSPHSRLPVFVALTTGSRLWLHAATAFAVISAPKTADVAAMILWDQNQRM